MTEQIAHMVREQVWAVVGVSNNQHKFGYQIYRFLQRNGRTVFPVNPNETSIGTDTCYPDVGHLPQKPGVVDIVVPPKAALQVLCDCHAAGINQVWLQPGAESDEAIDLAEKLGLAIVHHACVMVEM